MCSHVYELLFHKFNIVNKRNSFFYNLFTPKEKEKQCRYESPREEAREAHCWLAVKRIKRVYLGCIIIPCLKKGGKGKDKLLYLIKKLKKEREPRDIPFSK